MVVVKFTLVLTFLCFVSAGNVTFKNVTIHGYSALTHKFKKVIVSSESLKRELPNSTVDAVEIRHQDMPVLYENSISDIADLNELILEENNIKIIHPGAFRNLSLIRLIRLKRNEIETIKEGVFNNLSVSDLDLRQNQISVIEDKAFDNMKNLLNVRLSYNKLSRWNKNWFQGTPLLTDISFQHNLIEELPADAFSNIAGTESSGKIPLTLIFSYNKIKILDPNTFRGLNKLNILWLDNNLLEEIPTKLLDGVSLQEMRLGTNKLTCIHDKDALLKAKMNYIDDNPLDCDCLNDIKRWAKEKNISVFMVYADMNCDMERLQNKIKAARKMLEEKAKNNSTHS